MSATELKPPSKMSVIRGEWENISFVQVSGRVSVGDKELVLGLMQAMSAMRLIDILEGRTLEDVMETAYTLTNRNSLKGMLTYEGWRLWKAANPKLSEKQKRSVEEIDEYVKKRAEYQHSSDALTLEIRRDGMDAEKYEAAAKFAALSYAYSMLATGKARILVAGKRVVINNVV